METINIPVINKKVPKPVLFIGAGVIVLAVLLRNRSTNQPTQAEEYYPEDMTANTFGSVEESYNTLPENTLFSLPPYEVQTIEPVQVPSYAGSYSGSFVPSTQAYETLGLTGVSGRLPEKSKITLNPTLKESDIQSKGDTTALRTRIAETLATKTTLQERATQYTQAREKILSTPAPAPVNKVPSTSTVKSKLGTTPSSTPAPVNNPLRITSTRANRK